MEQPVAALGPSFTRTTLRTGLGIVALLILRAVIASLPVLKNGSTLGDTLLSPVVITNATIDTLVFLALLQFALQTGHMIRAYNPKYADLGKIIIQLTILILLILAYRAYELPCACFFIGRTDLANMATTANQAGSAEFLRLLNMAVNQLNAAAIQSATGDALAAYQQVALAVFRRPPDVYAWIFLLLVAIPVISLIPLVRRNLDPLAEFLLHAANLHPAFASRSPDSSASPVPAAKSSESEGITLRQLVERVQKIKALSDAGGISSEDFARQKARVLANPALQSDTEAEDFLRLKALLDSGALSADEYEYEKQRFLSQL
ncbi:MAG TPA: SHOCT domain-containing protein [Terracidiphilus sp.]|nr:SHOCT domain-containing protein [Terracidiphilus sp.]